MRVPLFFVLILSLFAPGCDDESFYSPKPRGYPRIAFPEKSYRLYDSVCPYAFEIPRYAFIAPDRHQGAEPCWVNVEIPRFKATIHLSYKAVTGNLATYLDDSHEFANRHQIKATGVDEIPVVRDSAHVYGLVFDISGNTASNVQFYLTDSTRHFLRGALYFNAIPNADSLRIVVDFLKDDILHLIGTTRWKEATGNSLN